MVLQINGLDGLRAPTSGEGTPMLRVIDGGTETNQGGVAAAEAHHRPARSHAKALVG